MKDEKSELNREFSRSHDHAPKPTKRQAEMPSMIERNKPMPRPRPPSVGRLVEAQHFNRQWGKDVRAFRNRNGAAAHKHMSTQELKTAWRREMQSVKQFGQFQKIDKESYAELHNNARIIKRSGLKLTDKFEQIERRAQQRNQDRGRER